MSTVTKIQRNYQVTIPSDIRKEAHLNVGDLVDFEITKEGILIKPQETIDRSQAWFWSKGWQKEERTVQKDFKKGRAKVSDSVDDFISELDE